MQNVEIPGYVYSGDTGSVADYGGRWYGVTRETCGHVIECIGIGAGDLESGKAEVRSADIYVRGHVEMREALRSIGWQWNEPGMSREQRRALLLDAYYGYFGGDTNADFGGPYVEQIDPDADDADEQVIALANRWAR